MILLIALIALDIFSDAVSIPGWAWVIIVCVWCIDWTTEG